MTGLERVLAVFEGRPPDRTPVVPIVHSGLAPMFSVPLGKFFTDARTMAETIVRGYREFGYDGVQLSLGVTAEAEAFGARIEQPENAAPLLKEHLLADMARLDALRGVDPAARGRFPLFREAIGRVADAIGKEAFIILTLRGPLLMAAQLRGVETVLLDMLDAPETLDTLLDFTAETSLRLGRAFSGCGAHALMLGEATCSPSFISPASYRRFVRARHKRLVSELHASGWQTVGLHICGNLTPILEDVIATGPSLVDIDCQVSAAEALILNRGRTVLRGNLDPSTVFAFGTPEVIRSETARLASEVAGEGRWIYSSGCDISPGTPAENMRLAMASLNWRQMGC